MTLILVALDVKLVYLMRFFVEQFFESRTHFGQGPKLVKQNDEGTDPLYCFDLCSHRSH
jgi:hypothetical protein